ncbi:fluoride efflux transporter FluC [Sporosarcina highlanderae]|uniref:Fluoride-specific ion channel FluC n=1 Tax=Sporosarcina highlanderae TaxID=3035916 RepID=A0ABT8JRX2_9BACL|nr:CrcB family protein [Sporosarcina highlanderae]MDN4607819.1 CrcB family protein [Sporosarcina highlanderae]
MRVALLVGFSGAIGAILRVSIGEVEFGFGDFPAATFAVNMVGTFFLCFLSAGFIQRLWVNHELQTALTTGFLGSFTTFSAFSMETVSLFQNGAILTALLYVLSSIFGGILFGNIGMNLGRKAGREE